MVINALEFKQGRGVEMTINNELIDDLLRDYKKPEDIIGEKWAVEAAHQSNPGACDASRDERAPRV